MANSKKVESKKVYNNKPKDASATNNAWWTEDENTKERHIWAKVKAIRQDQSLRRSDFLRYARLYSNAEFDQFLSGLASSGMNRKLSFNLVRSCVDTACAKISQAKTRPLILTNAGDYSQTKRAKKLTQYLDGIFDDTKFYSHARKSFREGGIFGTGAIKVFAEFGKIKIEKVFIDEIVVDHMDARTGTPREMHQVKLYPREKLLAMFKSTEQQKWIKTSAVWWEIEKAPRTKVDLVGVIESWHLPSSPTADDGKHVISIDNFTLLDEPYKKDYYPILIIHWNEPILGFYGEGIAAQLIGIQLEVNTVLRRIKEAQELVAVPRVLVQKGSGVNASHITDEIGGIIYYAGQKPEFNTPQAMNKEAYDYLEYLYQKGFQEIGVSQLSASAKKPAGLDSGAALREYQDIGTERFALVSERWQDLAIETAHVIIDIQRDLAKTHKNLSVKVKQKDFIETIEWKDVDMDADKFVMTVYPTNFLPRTPEGQLQYTQELVQSGFIDQTEALSLLNFPDLQGFFRLRTASIDDIASKIEKMIDDGDYAAPEPYEDLGLAVRMTQSAYLRAKAEGVKEGRLELLRRFIDACQNMLLQASAPPQGPLTTPTQPGPSPDSVGVPQGPGPGGGPGAVAKGTKAPRSDLIPLQQPAAQ